MDATELYEYVLKVKSPWYIAAVDESPSSEYGGKKDRLIVTIEHSEDFRCPICGKSCKRHDARHRQWRHLDTCEAETILQAEVPRVRCSEHGVHQVEIPWADGRAPYSTAFESYVIDLLHEGSVSGVARIARLSWDAIDGIKKRAVKRGLERRGILSPRHIGVDETSAKKRHNYITVVSDQETGHVLHVEVGKDAESLGKYYQTLDNSALNRLESVCMDMSPAFLSATQSFLPHADQAICFDHFHVIAAFNKALNKVRVRENKHFRALGDESLTGTRYDWLVSAAEIDGRTRTWFGQLTKTATQTARAWAIKEAASRCWRFASVGWARKAWMKLIGWIDRCRIPEMKELSGFIKRNLWGMLNAISFGVTNSPAEGINARIQKIKSQACGFKNEESFKTSVYFHLGGLDLYP